MEWGGFSDNVRLSRENNIEDPQDQLMMIMGWQRSLPLDIIILVFVFGSVGRHLMIAIRITNDSTRTRAVGQSRTLPNGILIKY